MILDLHTHTSRYSPCSRISLEELIMAERTRVDGIAITDHDHLMSGDEAERLTRRYGFLILPGVEISADWIYAHILAFGIEKEIKPDLGVEETIAKVHEQGGVAIAAHPFRYTDKLGKEWGEIDGIETLNPNCSPIQNMKAAEVALERKLPQIGCSDVHSPSMVGTYATKLEGRIINIGQLKDALLRSKVKPEIFITKRI